MGRVRADLSDQQSRRLIPEEKRDVRSATRDRDCEARDTRLVRCLKHLIFL